MKNIYLFLMLVLIGFSSCSKESKDDPKPADPNQDPAAMNLTTQLITGTTWQLISLTQGVPGSAIKNDIYNTTFPACQKDDVYKFVTTGNALTIEENYTLCGTTPQNKQGTWSLKSAIAVSISVPSLSQVGLVGDFTISSLTNNRMILTKTVNGSEYIAMYETQVPLTKEQILTGKTWQMTASVYSENNGTPQNLYDSMAVCQKDNVLKFTVNKTYSFEEGATKCNPFAPQVYASGVWAISADEKKLILDNQDEFEILTLTPTTFSFKETVNYFGDVFTWTYTYAGI